MAWTEEKRAKALEMYAAGGPTPANSMELCKEIAEEIDETANGVRLFLMKAEVYVKKEAAPAAKADGAKKASGEGSKRVSKEDSIKALKDAIEAKGKDLDNDILDKLTGKAAVYLLSIISD